MHGLAGFASWSHVPMPQAWGAAVAPAQYSPTLHCSQTAGVPAVPAAICFVPAAHEPCGTHCPALTLEEYVPAGHGVHTWSALGVPAADTYPPAWQTDHP